jgi:hypothetical protein
MQLPERWSIIHDHPDYKVSSHGRTLRWKSGKRTSYTLGKILAQKVSTNGYSVVSLDNKWYRLHRVVARAFLGPCPKGKEVNHLDGCKTNNRADNLEYVTPAENIRHALQVLRRRGGTQRGGRGHRLFTPAQVAEIRERLSKGESQRSLSLEFGVSAEAIRYIHIGRSYK